MRTTRGKSIVIAVAAIAVVVAGGAIAATGPGTPREESKAILDDAAKQLGVDSAKLSHALETAMANRVDAAVAAGRLSKEQGDALKGRIRSDELPLLGLGRASGLGHHGPGMAHGADMGHGPGMPHGAFGAKLDAAADYLGMTGAELRTQLESGKSLADVARAEGKPVAGLVAALVAEMKKQLDAAVSAERLTRAQADAMLAMAEKRIASLVDGALPGHGGHARGFGGGPAFHAPMPAGARA